VVTVLNGRTASQPLRRRRLTSYAGYGANPYRLAGFFIHMARDGSGMNCIDSLAKIRPRYACFLARIGTLLRGRLL
jgi:hypothetical protein